MSYKKSIDEILNEYQVDALNGLNEGAVAKNRELHGRNELDKPKKDSFFKRVLLQFKDILILLLLAAALISFLVDPHEWLESVIIVVVVLFTVLLGVIQESNAEKSLEALEKMSAPQATVLRDGQRQTVEAKEVVVGDIVLLEAGDFIPSDGRLLESHHLQIDESTLTGESLPVTKTTEAIIQEKVPLGDQTNMAFSGTTCTYGRGKMIVTSVGMSNEVGKIAGMLMNEKQEQTPIQIKLDQISKIIGIMCLVICVVVFVLEYQSGMGWLDAFKTSVALAVAAIPEGLATVVTVVLALGVSKMVKKNAIIRYLPAVETLGSASVICSDKTGTLTQNKMTVVKAYQSEHGLSDFTGKEEKFKEMMRYFSLCSDGEIKIDGDRIISLGDPTETALVEASYRLGEVKEELYKQYQRSGELAFDSDRKMMSVFYTTADGIISITKGAPDVVISRCKNKSDEALEINEQLASDALRVLAVAIRKWDKIPEKIESDVIEKDLEFVGLIGMIDPPRLEVKKAIEEAKAGGIKTVMITGDHLTTATAIAKELGIYQDGDMAITGVQLDQMSDVDLKQAGENIRVYARVAPEHKVRIVEMWQEKNHVVAMTGDGVNDSPALKASDIGCAMGITGTDVSKGAADMILTDDNFATIVEAVKEGRTIYANIKKNVQFLLSSNIGEVFTIFMASVLSLFGMNYGVPLLPIHLLWVNLITDSLPAFALGMEPAEDGIMNDAPRPKNESFFANHLGWTIAWQGIMIGSLTLISYLIGNQASHDVGMSMAFMTLSMGQLFHSFNMKSSKTIFSKSLFNNKYLWLSFGVGVLLQFLVMYTPANAIFNLVPLSWSFLLTALVLSMGPIVIVEIVKQFKK
ncbi:MAG: calcium-translocating P-type ATPase, PMCA-type [Anaerorhabdus sp.]